MNESFGYNTVQNVNTDGTFYFQYRMDGKVYIETVLDPKISSKKRLCYI